MGRFTEILNNSAPTGSVLDVNIVNGSINVDVTVGDYMSVTQSGAYLTILGSVHTVNSVETGSNMYIPAGSVLVTNPGYLGSTYSLSGTMNVEITNPGYLGSTFTVSGLQEVSQTDEFVPTSKEYINLVAGSPTATIGVFSQVVNHVSLTTMEGSMIVMLDGTAGLDSGLFFPAYSRDTYNCTCGSVSAYGVTGSLFALGTW